MAIAQVTAGNRIVTSDLNAFYNLLKGVSGSGESVTFIYNAAGSHVFQPSSDPAAGTEAVQIKNNAGTVQSALSFDGRFYAADGLVGTPGVVFESEKTSGLYRVGAGDVALAILGVKVAEFTATAATIVQPLTITGASIAISTNPAASGAVRIPNTLAVKWRNQLNNGDVGQISVDASNNLQVGDAVNPVWLQAGAGTVDFRYATTALGAGGAATLGLTGGSGPATTTQNSWLKVQINGTASYVPVWR